MFELVDKASMAMELGGSLPGVFEVKRDCKESREVHVGVHDLEGICCLSIIAHDVDDLEFSATSPTGTTFGYKNEQLLDERGRVLFTPDDMEVDTKASSALTEWVQQSALRPEETTAASAAALPPGATLPTIASAEVVDADVVDHPCSRRASSEAEGTDPSRWTSSAISTGTSTSTQLGDANLLLPPSLNTAKFRQAKGGTSREEGLLFKPKIRKGEPPFLARLPLVRGFVPVAGKPPGWHSGYEPTAKLRVARCVVDLRERAKADASAADELALVLVFAALPYIRSQGVDRFMSD